jgi:hypothetical protein
MIACVQSVVMFGSELWWKGDQTQSTKGWASDLQLLVNREARAVTGCFRTTNLGALAMESGIRPATAQLENRQRRFGLRLLSLSQGDQAKEVTGAASAIGERLECALGYSGRTESAILLEVPVALAAETIQEDEAAAKVEVERPRSSLAMFSNGQRWVGLKSHMG